MGYTGWRSLKRSKPPLNELVELMYMITGAGSPERQGWESVGRLRENGRFSIIQNESKTVDFRPPTHWKLIKK
tara:strand:+ start:2592 stop:2810 length:219 start_codon:yes stop_codon:yes gene_type:complete